MPDLEFEDMPDDMRFTPEELKNISYLNYVKEEKPAPNNNNILKELEELQAKYAQQQIMLKRLESKLLQTDRTLKQIQRDRLERDIEKPKTIEKSKKIPIQQDSS